MKKIFHKFKCGKKISPGKKIAMLRQRFILGIATCKGYATSAKIDQQSMLTYNTSSSYVSDLHEQWQQAKPFKTLPGPTKFQMIFGFRQGGEFDGKPFGDVLEICRKRYGNIFKLPGMFGVNTKLITFNVDDYEKIFRTEGDYPSRPGNEAMVHYRRTKNDDLYDEEYLGIIANGEQWSKFRHAANPLLMQPKYTVHYIEPMQKINDDFVNRIRQIRDPVSLEVPKNFLTEIHRLSFESVAAVALDKEFGLVRNESPLPEAQILFDNLQILNVGLYELGVQPTIYKYFKTPTYKRFEKAMDTITDICRKFVNEKLQHIEVNDLKGEEKSVLEKLIKMDRRIAIIMAIDLLFAGTDATSTIMSAVLLCLATNLEKQAKLREEILNNIGDKTAKITKENMKNLPYLRACIKETMRLYPILIANMRSTGMDLPLSGYQIPKGTNVFMSNMLMQEECNFVRPKEFIPERWLRSGEFEMNNEMAIGKMNPFLFLPFGFGRRLCAGKRLVDLELEITVANVVRNFKMEYNYPIDNAFCISFLNACVVPLNFKFIDIN